MICGYMHMHHCTHVHPLHVYLFFFLLRVALQHGICKHRYIVTTHSSLVSTIQQFYCKVYFPFYSFRESERSAQLCNMYLFSTCILWTNVTEENVLAWKYRNLEKIFHWVLNCICSPAGPACDTRYVKFVCTDVTTIGNWNIATFYHTKRIVLGCLAVRPCVHFLLFVCNGIILGYGRPPLKVIELIEMDQTPRAIALDKTVYFEKVVI